MAELIKDLRYAIRMLAKAPVASGIAAGSLALSLAANIAIFSFINAVFLRGVPVDKPEEMVVVYGTDAKQGQQGGFMPISRPNFEDYRDRSQVFAGMADLMFTGASLVRGEGQAEQVAVQLVSGGFFDLLGTKPALGRFFLPEEDEVPGRNPVAVLTWDTFQKRFGSDPAVVGGTVSLNGRPYTVVGVAPKGFTGAFVLGGPALWVPTMSYDLILPQIMKDNFRSRRALLTIVLARLRPGVGIGEAEAAVKVIAENLQREYPQENGGRGARLMGLAQASLPPQIRANFIRGGGLLMTVVALVLLIACANVANLLLARALGRRTEIAVRLSLGAGRRRLIRQLLTESLLLGGVSSLLGLVLAFWLRSLLWAARPPFMAQLDLDLAFDGRVIGFTLGVSLLTSLLFGLAPALAATRPEVVGSLKLGGAVAGGAGRLFSLRNLLVTGQVALSLIALIGSGLFLRSLGRATDIDPGFDAREVGSLTLNTDALGFDRARAEPYFDTVLERVRRLPGVESATYAAAAPLAFGYFRRTVLVDGRDPKAENNGLLTSVDPVGEGYFKTMGIPLLSGRDFTPQDRMDAPYAAILNETGAKRFWPGEDALGKRFHFFGQDWIVEVVGIVKDSKYDTVGEEPQAFIYLPRWQHYAGFQTLLIRTSGELAPVLGTVRSEVQLLDRNMPVQNVQTMSEVLRQSLWPARTAATLLGIFGGVALFLALVGIYGVMSYNVSQRHREIGIRMALGARPESLVGMLIGHGMRVVGVGLAIGLVLALVASQAIASLLFGIAPHDLLTWTMTTLLMAAVALLAILLPARRASAIDPVLVLKGGP